MAVKIQLRGDTKANWETVNPVLAEREMVIETDTNRTKIGNGTNNYIDLPYSDSFLEANLAPRQSLSNLKQLFYRNLEGDNLLPLVDYSGRTRPIGTAMEMVDKVEENGTTYYIVANVPYITDLLQNPTNWLIFADTTGSDYLASDGWAEYTFTAVKILTAEYLGDYETSTNCYKFSTITPIIHKLSTTLGIGDKMFVFTFKSYGINIRPDAAFPPNATAGSWNLSHTHTVAFFKHSDGYYIALVNGKNNTMATWKNKWFKCDGNPMTDTWEQLYEGNDCDIVGLLPSPYTNMCEATGIFKKPGRDGVYITAFAIGTSQYSMSAIALFEYSEDLTHKKFTVLDISGYTFNLSMSQLGYGVSYVFYKGKHLISVIDGNHNTGKGIVLMSDNIEGVYSHHSTVYDWSEAWMKANGSIFKSSIAGWGLFVYNDSLYAFTSGESGEAATGLAAKHQGNLWKYDDAKNTWQPEITPCLMATHGNPSNYSGLTGYAQAHIGASSPLFVEGNKLWFAYKGRNIGVNYTGSVAYIDLNEALK